MERRNPMPPAIANAVLDRAEGTCEAMIPGECTGRAEHLHHRKMRSQGGEHTEANLIAVCGACHRAIHNSGAWSYERELLVRAWKEPEFPPVYYRGIYGKEDDDGTYPYD